MSTKLSAYMGGLGIDARDKLEVVANATVTVGDGSALGNVDYSEQHDVATNGYGVASFTVGNGTPITGSYAAVNWSGNDYFLKTELDIQNNGNFQLMGTSQILAVPYASHANTASNSLVDNDTSATNEITKLNTKEYKPNKKSFAGSVVECNL